MTDTSDQKIYYNLHITGLGYLNRIREVKPKNAASFLAVDISAMHGNEDAVQYTRFDCIVRGSEAQQIVRQLKPRLDADERILVKFKLGDLTSETFTYGKGEKQGQTGVSLKARLIRIDWAKVRDQYVIPPKVKDETPAKAA